MRIDLSSCNLKTCRFCQDGNCTDKNKHISCDFTLLKAFKEKVLESWIDNRFPSEIGDYHVLMIDQWTNKLFNSVLKWNGKEFEHGKGNIVVGWREGENN